MKSLWGKGLQDGVASLGKNLQDFAQARSAASARAGTPSGGQPPTPEGKAS